jgi:predicted AAA+ superfamily ATPase
MYERLLTRHVAGGTRSALLLGPRQVGKSTLLASLHPDITINLTSPATFRDYVATPERLEQELRASPAGTRTVLLDEVQRVPSLLDVVQTLIDESPRRFRFLLSGSSARKLRRGHANLLPGRIHLHHLHPLVAQELGEEFDLERALAHGTLPGVWSQVDPEERARDLRAYTDLYLREEVQAEALVRNLGGYARLLDLVAASSGKILNLLALCRDAGLGYETARRYVEILEDTLIVHRLPAWSDSDRASLVAHPKLLLFDVGVRNALLRRPLDRCLDDERGLLLEHYLAHELIARRGTFWPELSVSFFRDRSGNEVDFVLEAGRETWAVEVKAGTRIDSRDLRGLDAFASRARRKVRKLAVFLGRRAMILGDVEVLPLERFLAELPR